MSDEAGPSADRSEKANLGSIAFLTDEERAMLREFADTLRRRIVRNPVARQALDRAAEQLERVAAVSQNDSLQD